MRIMLSITPEQGVLILLDPYRRYIQMFADKDEKIKEVLIKKNIEIVEYHFAKNDPLTAEDYLRNLLGIEESEATQDLIVRHIKLLEAKGMKAQAESYYRKIEGQLSIWQKIKFQLKGWLTLMVPAYGISLFIFLIGYLLFLNSRSKKVETEQKINSKLSPKYQRFAALLSYFELSAKASISEIKKAYRSRVQESSPRY